MTAQEAFDELNRVGVGSAVRMELELAPAAAVRDDLRYAVEASFREAGLEPVFVPMRGDLSEAHGVPVARTPSLHVRLRLAAAVSAAGALAATRRQLTTAIAAVRHRAPTIPIGIEVVDSRGHRRFFAFSLNDSAASISEAMEMIERASEDRMGAMGWDSKAHEWRVL